MKESGLVLLFEWITRRRKKVNKKKNKKLKISIELERGWINFYRSTFKMNFLIKVDGSV